MYEVTSIPLVRRTRATLRSAEFGFFGVEVYTRTHTPRFCGQRTSAGLLVRERCASRPTRINWLTVGTNHSSHGKPSEKLGDTNRTPGARSRLRFSWAGSRSCRF